MADEGITRVVRFGYQGPPGESTSSPTGAAGGGLAGTYPNPTIAAGISLTKLDQGGASVGYYLAWNGTSWAPTASSEFSAGGDLTEDVPGTQRVVAATGAGGVFPIADTGALIKWATVTVSPGLAQFDNTTNSATASSMFLIAQNATGTTSTGGTLVLGGGTGTSADGAIHFYNGVTLNTMFTAAAISMTPALLQWGALTSGPTLRHIAAGSNVPTTATTIRAQDSFATATGANTIGADLILSSGADGSDAGRWGEHGDLVAQCGGVEMMRISSIDNWVRFVPADYYFDESANNIWIKHKNSTNNAAPAFGLSINGSNAAGGATGANREGGYVGLVAGTGIDDMHGHAYLASGDNSLHVEPDRTATYRDFVVRGTATAPRASAKLKTSRSGSSTSSSEILEHTTINATPSAFSETFTLIDLTASAFDVVIIGKAVGSDKSFRNNYSVDFGKETTSYDIGTLTAGTAKTNGTGSTWSATVTRSTDTVSITVTGEADTTVKWTAVVQHIVCSGGIGTEY